MQTLDPGETSHSDASDLGLQCLPITLQIKMSEYYTVPLIKLIMSVTCTLYMKILQ